MLDCFSSPIVSLHRLTAWTSRGKCRYNLKMVFRTSKALKSQKGFSLIEVLIALSIMMGSLIVVSMAWSTSQLRIRKMKFNHQAAFLLDYKLADVERFYKDQLARVPDEDSGTFEELGKEYSAFAWKLKSKKFELPDLTPILAQKKNGGDALLAAMMSQMSEYFNQAAKEVTVTVTYTLQKKNVNFSATTFIVDFNQQLPLPNMGGGALPGGGADGP